MKSKSISVAVLVLFGVAIGSVAGLSLKSEIAQEANLLETSPDKSHKSNKNTQGFTILLDRVEV